MAVSRHVKSKIVIFHFNSNFNFSNLIVMVLDLSAGFDASVTNNHLFCIFDSVIYNYLIG